jgi:hypothetical protein
MLNLAAMPIAAQYIILNWPFVLLVWQAIQSIGQKISLKSGGFTVIIGIHFGF